MEKISDEALIEKLKGNDSSSLNLLFNRYYHRLVIFANTIVRDINIAEEVASDVFVQIWLNRNQHDIRNVKAYFFKSTYNKSLNYLNSAERMKIQRNDRLPLNDTLTNEFVLADAEDSNAEYIRRVIATMPPQRRIVFSMAKLEGFSYEEIAATLSIARGTVHQHLVIAMRYLTKHLTIFKKIQNKKASKG
jgi:RNA polymerase sigma-70 factor (family 1)